MKRWVFITVGVVANLYGALAVTIAIAGYLWKLSTRRSIARLHVRHAGKSPPFSHDDLAGLPEPVVRYFAFALTPGQALVCNARLRQIGEMAIRPDSWSAFTAVEHFSVDPPGFLWDARIRMAAMRFYVRDGYVRGEGAMYGALAALVPVVNVCGTQAMAAGELLRYLAEAVFLPTALLPRRGIAWTSVSEHSARVALGDGPTTVSCLAEFGDRGEIVRVSAMRYRDASGRSELTPWVGHFGDYRRVEGMMIPMTADVEWILPAGPSPYWRGRIVDASYEFAPT